MRNIEYNIDIFIEQWDRSSILGRKRILQSLILTANVNPQFKSPCDVSIPFLEGKPEYYIFLLFGRIVSCMNTVKRRRKSMYTWLQVNFIHFLFIPST